MRASSLLNFGRTPGCDIQKAETRALTCTGRWEFLPSAFFLVLLLCISLPWPEELQTGPKTQGGEPSKEPPASAQGLYPAPAKLVPSCQSEPPRVFRPLAL